MATTGIVLTASTSSSLRIYTSAFTSNGDRDNGVFIDAAIGLLLHVIDNNILVEVDGAYTTFEGFGNTNTTIHCALCAIFLDEAKRYKLTIALLQEGSEGLRNSFHIVSSWKMQNFASKCPVPQQHKGIKLHWFRTCQQAAKTIRCRRCRHIQ